MKVLVVLLTGLATSVLVYPWLAGRPLARLAQVGHFSPGFLVRVLARVSSPAKRLERVVVSTLVRVGQDRFPAHAVQRTVRLAAGAVIGSVLGVATTGFGSGDMSGWWWGGCAGAAAAWLGPEWKEGRQKKRLGEEIRRSLPEFLDILVICCQAGLNLRLGLERAAGAVKGRLEKEVKMRLDSVPPGRILPDLAQQCSLPELRMVAAAVWQGEVLGLPTAQVLREQAEQVREASRQRAAAVVATIPLKLSLCTVCFFLPAVLLLVLLPQLMVFLARW